MPKEQHAINHNGHSMKACGKTKLGSGLVKEQDV